MPNPGIAALPHASVGILEESGGARLGDVRCHLRIVGRDLAADGDVRFRRVGQVGEGECPPDDRHRVARCQPRLPVAGGPIARAAREATGVAYRRRSAARSARRRSRPRGRVRPSTPRSRCGVQPDRHLAGRPGLLVVADRSVPARAAREDPHVARRVGDPEPDRALLVEAAKRQLSSTSIDER